MYGPVACTRMNNRFHTDACNLVVYPNAPNPFNTSTLIRFYLNEPSMVKVTIYDNLGRQIEVLHQATLQTGLNTLNWKADNFASGRYYFTIDATQSMVNGKMNLVK